MSNQITRVIVERLPESSLCLRDFLPALVATLVALVGTWVVQRLLLRLQHQLDAKRESDKRADREFSTGNSLLFTLQAQRDVLNAVNTQLDKVRDDPQRWRKLPDLTAETKATPEIDRTGLSFILEDAPALARRLLALQLDFDSILSAVGKRNQCLDDFLRAERTADSLRGKFQVDLQTVTEQIYQTMDLSLQQNAVQRMELAKFIGQRFPHRKTIENGRAAQQEDAPLQSDRARSD